MYIHTTLLPYLKAAGEMKTKPTQHSVKELRGLGIQPNMLVIRTEEQLVKELKTNWPSSVMWHQKPLSNRWMLNTFTKFH